MASLTFGGHSLLNSRTVVEHFKQSFIKDLAVILYPRLLTDIAHTFHSTMGLMDATWLALFRGFNSHFYMIPQWIQGCLWLLSCVHVTCMPTTLLSFLKHGFKSTVHTLLSGFDAWYLHFLPLVPPAAFLLWMRKIITDTDPVSVIHWSSHL